MLAFAYKHWEGKIPEPGELTSLDKDLLAEVQEGFLTVGQEIEAVHLRAALAEAMRLATEVNKYLDQTAPWQAVKTDKAAAGRAIYTAIQAIDMLKILFAPFLPFTSEKLNKILGYSAACLAANMSKRRRIYWASTASCVTMPVQPPVPGNPGTSKPGIFSTLLSRSSRSWISRLLKRNAPNWGFLQRHKQSQTGHHVMPGF